MKPATHCLTTVATLGLCLMLGPVVYAADAPATAPDRAPARDAEQDKPRAAQDVQGKISSVDGQTIQVTPKEGGKLIPVQTDDKTKIMLDGKAAKLADLRPGQTIHVVAHQQGEAATRILVTKGEGKDDAKPDVIDRGGVQDRDGDDTRNRSED